MASYAVQPIPPFRYWRAAATAPQPAPPSSAQPPPEHAPPSNLPVGPVRDSFTCQSTIEIDLEIGSPTLDHGVSLDQMPLAGSWSVVIHRVGDKVYFDLHRGALYDGAMIDGAVFEMRVEWEGAGALHVLASGAWVVEDGRNPPPAEYYGHDTSTQSYRLVITTGTLEQVRLATGAVFDPTELCRFRIQTSLRSGSRPALFESFELANHMSTIHLKPVVNDVRLFFPATSTRPDAELWASEAFLSSVSPYFRTLFGSGLAETVIRPKSEPQHGAARDLEPPSAVSSTLGPRAVKQFDDSDDETDKVETIPNMYDPLVDGSVAHKQIVITQAAYSTYRAVLLWAATGYISFASRRTPPAAAPVAGGSTLKDRRALPLPVSPKSVFRLSHFLELDRLAATAALFFRDEHMAIDKVHLELFSDLARNHSVWRSAVLDYAMQNWNEIKASEGWVEMKERVARDEVEGAGAVLVELTDRLASCRGV
ncbi:hypothetical protein JCM3775_005623 [Rhodotorula graminis]